MRLADKYAGTAPLKVMGEGSESVYVYFSASERKLALLEGRSSWPCKVGFTSGAVVGRILEQRPHVTMASFPVVGLVILSDAGRKIERRIHRALRRFGAKMVGALGNEWFETSPEQVEKIYLSVELDPPPRMRKTKHRHEPAIQKILAAAGGPKKIAEESQTWDYSVGLKSVYGWARSGIPDKHWPLIIALSSVTPTELHLANCNVRSHQ